MVSLRRPARAITVILLALALAGCSATTAGHDAGGTAGGATAEPPVLEGADAVVPGDFPSGLPLPDAELVLAMRDESGWRLEYRLDELQQAIALLERLQADPDHVVVRDTALGERRLVMLTSADYEVSLDFGPHDGEPFLRYLVLPVAESAVHSRRSLDRSEP